MPIEPWASLIWLGFVPQIEVTFDIDANGIVHVSAKDLGTGKEQKIRIESSSGLSEEEIEKMVKDAELNAEADKAVKEKAQVMNEADNLIYSTEKSLKDFGDKVGADDKGRIEGALESLKAAVKTDDIESIKAKTEELKQASYKLAEEMYKAQAPGAGAQPGPDMGGAAPGAGSSEPKPAQTDAEDADYEVVD